MKYDAFISYRHLEKDMFVAKGVHKALETAKIPRKIQKETGIKRIKRGFRDQEELPIGSDLTHNIDYALRESGFLIVICSPQTKESLWVMKEIDTFISLHGRENILAVLVDGEPVDSFPHQLLEIEEISYDAENNTVALYNYTDMYVVDVEGNSFIHHAPLGKIYFPGKQTIICANASSLYSFKVKTLDDLVTDFRGEFGDIELTTEQKLIYNID